jgi:hypothetical protein
LAKTAVQVGQRYRAVGTSFLGSPNATWVIEAVFTGADSVRYGLLVGVNDPSSRKTLSLDVLMDPKCYLLDPSSGPSGR